MKEGEHMEFTRTESVAEFVDWLHRQEFDVFQDRRSQYFRVGCGLDIETTNVIRRHRKKDDDKSPWIYDHTAAYAYAFMVTIGDHSLLCRQWMEILYVLGEMEKYGRKHAGRFFCWIANCSFEFQFFRTRIKIKSCFAKKARQPLYFNTERIHFADCLAITGGSLSYLSKNYTESKKKTGDLDYSIPRSWHSPLSDTEKDYCYTDTEILSEFFHQHIETEYIQKGMPIPYTQTGIIRAEVNRRAKETKGAAEFVRSAFPPSRVEYDGIMSRLFRGGYTHACAINANTTHYNVHGVDLTSSYPAVMLQCYFPMSVFVPVTLQCDGHLITDPLLQTHCCMMICDFWGIDATTMHTIESEHKLIQAEGAVFDNGRLIQAKHIRVHLTELDYETYTRFYKWDHMTCEFSKVAARGRLPKYLLDPLLELYRKKVQLKRWCKKNGIKADNWPEYQITKALVNSFYGLTVQRLRFITPIYDPNTGKWSDKLKNTSYASAIRYTMLLPQWGIWVTAHARHRITGMIHRIDPDKLHADVIYCDTDSIYFRGDHWDLIEEYNAEIAKLNQDLPAECWDLGMFDKIGTGDFLRFKTIGAKRYIKQYPPTEKHPEGEITATVAGLNGEAYVRKNQPDPFLNFTTEGFFMAAGEAWKLTSIYNDEPTDDLIDGVPMHEESSVSLCDIDFQIKPLRFYKLTIELMAERLGLYNYDGEDEDDE